MNTNMKAALAAATMMALALAPVANADTEYATSPAGLVVYCDPTTVPDVGTFCPFGEINNAVAFCQLIDAGVPLSCDGTSGDIAGVGGAFFDTTGWNAQAGASASYGRSVDISAAWVSGQEVDGFAILACSDWDDDDSSDTCKGSNVATNGAAATVTFCAEKDRFDAVVDPVTGTEILPADYEYDDYVVFVEAFVDASSGGPDAGASAGQFQVDSTDGAFVDQTSCDAINA